MVKCPSYVKEIFLQLFFWNQYLNQAHRFPLADMAFRSPFVSNSTSSFLFPHWCLLSEVVIWRICSINGRWVKFPPYAKDKKPTYGSGDTFQVLSEKNKKNIFFFQEEINTINSYRGNAAWHGEEMTKSKLRLFNTGIKGLLWKQTVLPEGFLPFWNPLKPIIRYVFRWSPWNNDPQNSYFMLKSKQKIFLIGKKKQDYSPF